MPRSTVPTAPGPAGAPADANAHERGPVRSPDDPVVPWWADRRFRVLLLGVLLLAVGVRVGTVYTEYRYLSLGLTDNGWYHHEANGLLDGHGFSNPFARIRDGESEARPTSKSPLYTVYLAGFSAIGLDSPTQHRYASGLAGAGAAVLAALLARRLAGNRAGVVAGVLAAASPSLWINDGMILSESIYAPLVLGVALTSVMWWQRPSARRAAVVGVVLGLAALARAEAALLGLVLVLPLVLARGGPWGARVRSFAACGAAALLVVAPWTVRNLVTFEEPTLLSGGFGFVLEAANCDVTYSGQFLGYWSDACWYDGTPPPGDESEEEAFQRRRAFAYIGDHVGELPKVAAARVGRVFGLYRPGQGIEFDDLFERRGVWQSQAALLSFWAMVPFAVAGAVAVRRRGWTVIPLVSVFVLVTISTATGIGISRYRSAVDALLPSYAAVGLVVAWAAIHHRRSQVAGAGPGDGSEVRAGHGSGAGSGGGTGRPGGGGDDPGGDDCPGGDDGRSGPEVAPSTSPQPA